MKKLFLPVFALLFATLIIAAMPTEAEAAIYSDTVRLHILAASDSDTDQRLKLEIRDELLKKYGSELKCAESTDEARIKISALLPEIEAYVEEEIRKRGFDYSATVTLTEEWYDTREYESFTLPSGNYTSLRIIIDEGRGKNWWCVMFPPMCTEIATGENNESYTESEKKLIAGGKYKIKFKTLELLNYVFSK